MNFTGSKSKFLSFWAVLTQAAFSLGGMETLAYRIVILYVLSLTIVGMCISRRDEHLLQAVDEGAGTAAQSPFVILMTISGIKVLLHIINAVILTSVFSSGNQFMYASSRALFQLAQQGQVPRILSKVNKQGIPYYAVAVSAAFGLLGFLAVGKAGAEEAFVWLGSITALGSMITWTGIAVTFLRFYYGMKAQGLLRNVLPFHTAFQPYFAWAVAIIFPIIIFFNGWISFHGEFSIDNFASSYVNIPFFALLFATEVVNLTVSSTHVRSVLSQGLPSCSAGRPARCCCSCVFLNDVMRLRPG
jgi:amino acid transporter